MLCTLLHAPWSYCYKKHATGNNGFQTKSLKGALAVKSYKSCLLKTGRHQTDKDLPHCVIWFNLILNSSQSLNCLFSLYQKDKTLVPSLGFSKFNSNDKSIKYMYMKVKHKQKAVGHDEQLPHWQVKTMKSLQTIQYIKKQISSSHNVVSICCECKKREKMSNGKYWSKTYTI